MLQREIEQRGSVRRQAFKIADGGQFGRWEEIAEALILERRPLVVEVLANPLLRIALNLRCAYAGRDERHRNPTEWAAAKQRAA